MAETNDRLGAVVLLVLVPGGVSLEEPVAALLDLDIAATSVDTRGLSDLIKHEIPIFGGVARRLPDSPSGRLLLSITTRERAEAALAELATLSAGTKPVLAVIVPAERVVGLGE